MLKEALKVQGGNYDVLVRDESFLDEISDSSICQFSLISFFFSYACVYFYYFNVGISNALYEWS